MKAQNFRRKDFNVVKKFLVARKNNHIHKDAHLNLSWSNWGFGMENLDLSLERLANNNIHWIELHGNKYGPDLGYQPAETRKLLEKHGVKLAGICGMVFPDSEFSSNNPFVRQRCIDYFRRQIEFCTALNGVYILFSPGAVGRPYKYDDNEFYRAAETIRIVADDFEKAGIRAGIEPVRRDEVSICHTFAEAKALIKEINHPGVRHIAGDLFHMLLGETHIGETIIEYGDFMTNLHMADTNRKALGSGMLDLDIVIMALYVIGYNNNKCFCSPEPLGTGSNPYDQLYGKPSKEMLDQLVADTAKCFYQRENEILTASDEELLGAYICD